MVDPIRYVKQRMIVFYHEPEVSPVPFPCTRCGRTLFVTNKEVLSVVNRSGISIKDFPTSMTWLELPCQNCKTLHKVLFQ